MQRRENEILHDIALNGSQGCETRKEVIAAQRRPDDAFPSGPDHKRITPAAGCFQGLAVQPIRKGDGHAVNSLGRSGIGDSPGNGVRLGVDRLRLDKDQKRCQQEQRPQWSFVHFHDKAPPIFVLPKFPIGGHIRSDYSQG